MGFEGAELPSIFLGLPLSCCSFHPAHFEQRSELLSGHRAAEIVTLGRNPH